MKKTRMILAMIIALVIAFSMTACSKPAENTEVDEGTNTETVAETNETTEDSTEPVTLKFFSNLPDRNAGQGELEQLLIDQYMAENPHVTIEVEALQDEPYKQKFKAYTASDNLPDIVMVYGQPTFMDPVVNSGLLAELNPSDYEDYNFIPGAVDGFSKDGKIYGLPRNTDVMIFYYNMKIFADYDITVPTTMDELIAIGDKLEGTDIAPCSVNGKDKWPLGIMYSDFVMKYTGDNSLIPNAIENGDFSDARLLEAAKEMEKINLSAFYQKSFTSADYGAARNMFAQSLAATYYMGNWEMGMVNDESLPEEFRSNIGVFSLPVPDNGKGAVTDLAAWHGGGYAVAEHSEVKGEAIKLLNYIFEPENWAKGAWQMGICFPGQGFEEFMTGEETDVQKEIIKILSSATSTSGNVINALGSPSFKTNSEDILQQFAANMIDAEEFIQKLEEASKE